MMVGVGRGFSLLMFPLALRTGTGSISISANFVDHSNITKNQPDLLYQLNNESTYTHIAQTGAGYCLSNLVKKYLPLAIELTLTGKVSQNQNLSKEQKVIVSKIYKNLNTICKLNVKEVKQLIKQQPEYQQALGDLYFDKKINNYMLITSYERPPQIAEPPLLEASSHHSNQIVNVQYRIQFTISNIAKKNVMRPIILLVFWLKDGSKLSLYYNIEQFTLLRAQIAQSMRQIYGVELRTL